MPRVRSLSEGPFSPGQCLCAALSSPAMLPIAWRGPGRGPSLPGTSCGANQRLQPWRGGPPSAAGGALRGLPCAFFCTGAGSLRPAGPGAGDVFNPGAFLLHWSREPETSRAWGRWCFQSFKLQRRGGNKQDGTHAAAVEKQPPSGARQGRAGREGGARGEEVGLPVRRQQRWPVPGLACPPEPAAHQWDQFRGQAGGPSRTSCLGLPSLPVSGALPMLDSCWTPAGLEGRVMPSD